MPKYKCPGCHHIGNWQQIKKHMRRCCPGLSASRRSQSACKIKEAAISADGTPVRRSSRLDEVGTVEDRIKRILQKRGGGMHVLELPQCYKANYGTTIRKDLKSEASIEGGKETSATFLENTQKKNFTDFLESTPSLVVQGGVQSQDRWVFLVSSDMGMYPAVASDLFGSPAPAAAASTKRGSFALEENGRQAALKRVRLAVEDTTTGMVTFDQAVSCIQAGTQNNTLNSMHAMPTTLHQSGGIEALFGADCDKETKEDPPPSISADEAHQCLRSFFGRRPIAEGSTNPFDPSLSLSDRGHAARWEEGALLGHLTECSEPGDICMDGNGIGNGDDDDKENDGAVYMNTHEPFCFAAVGVQGAGKSHTLSCILESCLLPFQLGEDVVKLKKPMTCLVLHYDQNTTSLCESAGLLAPNPDLRRLLGFLGRDVGAVVPPCVPRSNAVVMVSPTFYRQRKAFYGDYCRVKPLLFQWKTLTADHIKRIMRIQEGDNQLYVASFMTLLRTYQRQAVVPDFADFMQQVKKVCNLKGQQGPLSQRIALLESMVAESETNKELRSESLDLSSCVAGEYSLIITDLTDPLLSKEEANGLFQVLTEQFRSLPVSGGKLLCLDEAHKFMDGVKSDGLSEAIVDVARLMRHDGVRLAVSTQSPHALAPELLELVSVAVLHHFHSMDWWTYLQKKLSLQDAAWERILSLRPGDALAFATRHNLTTKNVEGSHILPIHVRPRITADLGASRRNV